MFLNFFQGVGKLVGTAGGSAGTADAVEFGNDLVDGHTFHQAADTLQIAVAAAVKNHIVENVIFPDFKFYVFGASSLRLILVFH